MKKKAVFHFGSTDRACGCGLPNAFNETFAEFSSLMNDMDEVMKCLDHLEARGGDIISQAKELIDSNRKLAEDLKKENEAQSEVQNEEK